MHEARKPAVKVSRNRAPVFDPPSSKRTRETFTGGEGGGMSRLIVNL